MLLSYEVIFENINCSNTDQSLVVLYLYLLASIKYLKLPVADAAGNKCKLTVMREPPILPKVEPVNQNTCGLSICFAHFTRKLRDDT